MASDVELALRLLLAAALAGVIGVEREITDQPAGFRTHILVGLGAALFAVISAYGFEAIAAGGPPAVVRADVTRVASQIVVGIGFLGGGAIVKYGASVRGLTTAASLWITAAIGTAIGIGMLALGGAVTAIALVAMIGLRPIRGLIRRRAIDKDHFVVTGDSELDLAAVVAALRDHDMTIREAEMRTDDGERTIRIEVRATNGGRPETIAEEIGRSPHVRSVDWSER
jgi:putative Mg2+ transporter-C (MgtC) family protein